MVPINFFVCPSVYTAIKINFDCIPEATAAPNQNQYNDWPLDDYSYCVTTTCNIKL